MAGQVMDGGRLAAPGWLRSAVERLEGETALDQPAERLAAAAAPLAEGRRGEVLRGHWLGHALHPLLTDFPLGCWLSSALLDLLGGRSARPASRKLVGLGLLFSLPTVASGLADYTSAAARQPQARRLGLVHGVGNLLVGGLYFRSWRSRRAGRHLRGVGWGFLAGSLAWVTGWLGGHLTTALAVAEGERGLGGGTSGSTGGGVTPGTVIAGTPGTVAAAGGAGPSGTVGAGRTGSRTAGDELLSIDEASERLGVPVDQVRAMVDQGLLVAADGGAGGPRFRDSDVEAVRLLGG